MEAGRKAHRMLKVIEGSKGKEAPAEEIVLSLDELARLGAQRMIACALKLEAEDYLARHTGERDERGHALVVGNGRGKPRKVTLGAGTIEVRAPRVDDRRVVEGARQRFTSKLLPPWMRKSPNVSGVLPLLYLRGLSTGDFREALSCLLGEEGAGLSASTISRLCEQWKAEYEAWKKRPLEGADYVYLWADGVHFGVRLEEDRLAVLVLVGVRPDGTKEVIALEDGYRESTESWAALLRDLKSRGMKAPRLAVGDGALGFWAAVGEVWPETKEQGCWVHKIANVLDKLPKRLQGRAKKQLHEMMYAESREECEKAKDKFVSEFSAKYPKAAESLERNWERMLTFFDFPAEHWGHLRTTNPIESAFATVKHRTYKTKGAGSRQRGLVMAWKLLAQAEKHWRTVNAPHLVEIVRTGGIFKNGIQVVEATREAAA